MATKGDSGESGDSGDSGDSNGPDRFQIVDPVFYIDTCEMSNEHFVYREDRDSEAERPDDENQENRDPDIVIEMQKIESVAPIDSSNPTQDEKYAPLDDQKNGEPNNFGDPGDSSDIENPSALELQETDSVERKTAKSILLEIKNMTVAPFPMNFRETRDFIASQEIIDAHLAILREMMDIAPVDPGREAMIMYVCKTFERAGVSGISGARFLRLSSHDQILLVLLVAREYVAQFWRDYSPTLYADSHRHMDSIVKFHVKITYHDDFNGVCCVHL